MGVCLGSIYFEISSFFSETSLEDSEFTFYIDMNEIEGGKYMYREKRGE